MRHTILAAVLLLGLGACATSAGTSSTGASTAATPTASATSRTPSPSASKSTATPSASASKATPSTPTLNGGTFDVLPAGYTYAYLSRLTQIGGRWAVVLDPLTVCGYPSKDPNCSDLTEEPPNGYEIKNLNTKTYIVPLASGTTLSLIGPSGQPGDFVTVPMAEKTWAADEVVVEYTVNASQQVATIKEWWRP